MDQKIDDIVVSSEVIPAPKTISLVKTGGATESELKSRRAGWIAVLAISVAIIIAAVVIVIRKKRAKSKADKFFTLYAQEEPTRSYTPYTGTIPFGTWGTKPWAEAFDLETPQQAYPYLPPPYRTFADIL